MNVNFKVRKEFWFLNVIFYLEMVEGGISDLVMNCLEYIFRGNSVICKDGRSPFILKRK